MIDLRPFKRLPFDQRQDLGVRLADGYRQGKSMAVVAQEVGTSVGRVRALLLEQGVPLRGPGGSRPGRLRLGWLQVADAAARQYSQGASLVEVGRRLDVSASSARRLVLAGGGSLPARGGNRRAQQR